MKFKVIKIILIFAAAVIKSQTATVEPVLECDYSIDFFVDHYYACTLTIINPDGFDNFTQVDGNHWLPFGNDDVDLVYRTDASNSTNFPSIICDTFRHTTHIFLFSIGLELIGENSFRNCENLQSLTVVDNKIHEIAENAFEMQKNFIILALGDNPLMTLHHKWFENLSKLEALYLRASQLTDLPQKIFNSLTSLRWLNLSGNKLTQIHSDSFGLHSNFTEFHFAFNGLTGFDERLMDNTGISNIDGIGNNCMDSSVNDTTPDRSEIRAALQQCFNDYHPRDD